MAYISLSQRGWGLKMKNKTNTVLLMCVLCIHYLLFYNVLFTLVRSQNFVWFISVVGHWMRGGGVRNRDQLICKKIFGFALKINLDLFYAGLIICLEWAHDWHMLTFFCQLCFNWCVKVCSEVTQNFIFQPYYILR